MADDLKRAKDLITDHFMRQGKEYLKTDDGKFFLARTLASRKDVKSLPCMQKYLSRPDSRAQMPLQKPPLGA